MMSQDFLLKKVEKHVEIAGVIFNISTFHNHSYFQNCNLKPHSTSLLIPVLALKNRCKGSHHLHTVKCTCHFQLLLSMLVSEEAVLEAF